MNIYISEVSTSWVGRLQGGRRSRGGYWGRSEWRHPGPGPLDVRDGGAHEPRVQPPPSLHVAQWNRAEDELDGAATSPPQRLLFISIIKYISITKTASIARIICAPEPQLQPYIIGK